MWRTWIQCGTGITPAAQSKNIMSISSISSSFPQRPDMAEMRQKLFSTADTDGSGSLSKDELGTGMQAMRKQQPPPGGMGGGPGGPGGAGGAKGSKEAKSVDDIFTEMDTDGSGEVSEEEMTAFDEAREAEMSSRSSSFLNSTDFLQNLLTQLGGDDEESETSASGLASATTSSSSSASSASDTDLRDQLITKLIKKLQSAQTASQTYLVNGTTSSTESVGLFSTTV